MVHHVLAAYAPRSSRTSKPKRINTLRTNLALLCRDNRLGHADTDDVPTCTLTTATPRREFLSERSGRWATSDVSSYAKLPACRCRCSSTSARSSRNHPRMQGKRRGRPRRCSPFSAARTALYNEAESTLQRSPGFIDCSAAARRGVRRRVPDRAVPRAAAGVRHRIERHPVPHSTVESDPAAPPAPGNRRAPAAARHR